MDEVVNQATTTIAEDIFSGLHDVFKVFVFVVVVELTKIFKGFIPAAKYERRPADWIRLAYHTSILVGIASLSLFQLEESNGIWRTATMIICAAIYGLCSKVAGRSREMSDGGRP